MSVGAIERYLKASARMCGNGKRKPNHKQLVADEITHTARCGTCHLSTDLGDELPGVSLDGNADPRAAINS
jgi:hypothetical protein